MIIVTRIRQVSKMAEYKYVTAFRLNAGGFFLDMNIKITAPKIREMKSAGDPITVLTAYDYQTARILDDCGVEVILVGDSLGNVVYGFDSTLPVTMEMMIAHTGAVVRGRKNALVVADMPFMSYQTSVSDAIANAGRLVKEAGAEAVKLEGGLKSADRIRAIVDADIPVMGHIGLRPQAVNMMGGYKVQGKVESERLSLIEDAKSVESAGAFAIVLEAIPSDLAGEISSLLSIPTIGIGAGPCCDGQVLVVNDMLGLSEFKPKFVRHFAGLSEAVNNAVSEYVKEVKSGKFPASGESFV